MAENREMQGEWAWLFHDVSAFTAPGVFASREKAEAWIGRYGLSGILTRMPMDAPAYAWAVRAGVFTPGKPAGQAGDFPGDPACASLEHYHYENGVKQARATD